MIYSVMLSSYGMSMGALTGTMSVSYTYSNMGIINIG